MCVQKCALTQKLVTLHTAHMHTAHMGRAMCLSLTFTDLVEGKKEGCSGVGCDSP